MHTLYTKGGRRLRHIPTKEGHKICSACLIEKPVDNFHKRKKATVAICIECHKDQCRKRYRRKHPEIHRQVVPEGFKICHKCGRALPKASFAKSTRASDGLQASCSACKRDYRAKAKSKDPKKFNEIKAQRARERYARDVNARIINNLRGRLQKFIHNKYGKSYEDRLGCTLQEFKTHIEKQFKEGMSWENYGFKTWHIDHIQPMSSFDLTKESELLACCHYTNMQPLWASDNLSKGNKIIG